MTDASDAPRALPGTKRHAVGTVLAWVCPVLLVISLVPAVVPVTNPKVQDCGAPIVSLLSGRQDAPLFTEAGEPLNGWNDAQRKAAYDRRCSVRVAERMLPAGIVFASFLVAGAAAVALTWGARRTMRKALVQRALDEHSAPD